MLKHRRPKTVPTACDELRRVFNGNCQRFLFKVRLELSSFRLTTFGDSGMWRLLTLRPSYANHDHLGSNEALAEG